MLDRQIPLLRVGKAISIEGSVSQVLTVAITRVDEWWRREVLRESLAQNEGRLNSAQRARVGNIGVESI